MNGRAEAVSRQVDILRSTGELSPAELEAISIRLQVYADEAAESAGMRLTRAAAAWLAAAVVVLCAHFVLQGRGLLPGGLLLLAAGTGLSRGWGPFAEQLGGALALAGNAALLAGAEAWFGAENLPPMPFLQLILCVILYPLIANRIFRLVAPLSVAGLISGWIVGQNAAWAGELLIAVEFLLFLFCRLRKRTVPFLFPLERATTLLLPATFLLFLFLDARSSIGPIRPSGLLLAAGSSLLLYHPQGGISVPATWRHALALACFLSAFVLPGMTLAVILLLLGKSRGERFLTILGGLSLPLFLFLPLYFLPAASGSKAAVMVGLGVLTLVLRRLVPSISMAEEKI